MLEELAEELEELVELVELVEYIYEEPRKTSATRPERGRSPNARQAADRLPIVTKTSYVV